MLVIYGEEGEIGALFWIKLQITTNFVMINVQILLYFYPSKWYKTPLTENSLYGCLVIENI